jgi:hypothetical protein
VSIAVALSAAMIGALGWLRASGRTEAADTATGLGAPLIVICVVSSLLLFISRLRDHRRDHVDGTNPRGIEIFDHALISRASYRAISRAVDATGWSRPGLMTLVVVSYSATAIAAAAWVIAAYRYRG